MEKLLGLEFKVVNSPLSRIGGGFYSVVYDQEGTVLFQSEILSDEQDVKDKAVGFIIKEVSHETRI